MKMKVFLIFTILSALSFFLSCSQNCDCEQKDKEIAVKQQLIFEKDSLLNLLKASNRTKEELWDDFWVLFSDAIKHKKKGKISYLSLKGNEFFDGGGGQTATEFVDRLDNEGNWHYIIGSVNTGVKNYEDSNKITKDNALIFVYQNNQWFWYGVMGD